MARQGIGEHLVLALLAAAPQHFVRVRLRTDNPAAARLYTRCGFQEAPLPDATHVLEIIAVP